MSTPQLPARARIIIMKGATFRLDAQLKFDGVAADFTGCCARMQLRPSIHSDSVLAELTTENNGVLLGAGGEVKLHISAKDTAAMEGRRAVGDLEIKWSNGDIWRVLSVDCALSDEVTR